MEGIPPDLNRRLHATLLKFGDFDENRTMRALFCDTRIVPWRDEIQGADSSRERVNLLIGFLSGNYNSKEENALILFLRVLIDQTHSDNALYGQLLELADALEIYADEDLRQQLHKLIQLRFKDKSEQELRKVFGDQRLSEWQDDFSSFSPDDTDAILQKLFDCYDGSDKNSLALFVRVLYDDPWSSSTEYKEKLKHLAGKLGLPPRLAEESRADLRTLLLMHCDDASFDKFLRALHLNNKVYENISSKQELKERIDLLLNYIGESGASCAAVSRLKKAGDENLPNGKDITWPPVVWNDGSKCEIKTPEIDWGQVLVAIVFLGIIICVIFGNNGQTTEPPDLIFQPTLTIAPDQRHRWPLTPGVLFTESLTFSEEGEEAWYAFSVAVAPHTLDLTTEGEVGAVLLDPTDMPISPTQAGETQRFALAQPGRYTLVIVGRGRFNIQLLLNP
jgi:hypothetical protein